jgi:hypothetical protein
MLMLQLNVELGAQGMMRPVADQEWKVEFRNGKIGTVRLPFCMPSKYLFNELYPYVEAEAEHRATAAFYDMSRGELLRYLFSCKWLKIPDDHTGCLINIFRRKIGYWNPVAHAGVINVPLWKVAGRVQTGPPLAIIPKYANFGEVVAKDKRAAFKAAVEAKVQRFGEAKMESLGKHEQFQLGTKFSK